MSLAGGFAVVADLRHRGFVLQPSAGKIRIAPSEQLTPFIRELLSSRKPEVLNALAAEERFSGMPLDQFEREGSPLEVRVPWLPETLWFVPGPRQVKLLVDRGISLGRIWTAQELRFIWSVPTTDKKSVEKLGRIKAEFGGEFVSLVGPNLGACRDV